MSTTDYDPVALGDAHIAGQARGKTKFKQLVDALTQETNTLLLQANQLYTCTSIDLSEGAQLDNIGRVIGQTRKLEKASPLSFFGFFYDTAADFTHAETFGDTTISERGGVFWENGGSLGSTADMDDPQYRAVLKARVITNNLHLPDTGPWVEAIYEVLQLIFQDTANTTYCVLDTGGMFLELGIGYPIAPTAKQISLLLYAGIVPLPMGVGYRATYWKTDAAFFGFSDTAGASAYGDNDYPSRGGRFAERIT